MPDAVITSIAKAVETAINEPPEGVEFSQEFVAERVHVPEYDTAKVSELKVFIVESGNSTNLEDGDRSGNNYGYVVSIGFYKAIKRTDGKPDMSEVDAMTYLVEQVNDYFVKMDRLAGYTDAMLSILKNDVPFDSLSLNDKGVFVSVTALTFQVHR